MQNDRATYIAELLKDIAKAAKYDYAIIEEAADIIMKQKAELDRLNKAIEGCTGGSLVCCGCNFNGV